MSQENPAAGRSIEERVALRLPTPVVGLLSRGLALLPPGSRSATERNSTKSYESKYGARFTGATPSRFWPELRELWAA